MRTTLIALGFSVLAATALAQPSLPPVEIVTLQHLDARSTVDIVARLLGPEGICAPHPETNSLIVIDDSVHVARIRDVVQRLESAAAQRTAVTHSALIRSWACGCGYPL